MTRGEKICAFIEHYCLIPEGAQVGQPIKLMKFQRKFILDVFDNPHGTSRAYLSVARKNGKSALIAAILLAHLVGPEARQNSQIISGARSRDQASLVFKLAEKMVRLSPELSKIVRIVPSQKMLVGLICNVEFKAISAESGTAHGLSPVLAILDEVGQVRGPHDAFIEAIETALIDVMNATHKQMRRRMLLCRTSWPFAHFSYTWKYQNKCRATDCSGAITATLLSG